MRSIFAVMCLLLSSFSFAAPLKVVASFSILGNLVQEVGGDHVQVNTLVGPGEDAHVWQAKPADLKKLSGASLFFVNGLGYEGWLKRVEQAAAYKGKVITVTQGLKPLALDDDHGHSHGKVDPHAWHDPRAVLLMVDQISAALQAADASHAAAYQANAAAFKAKITQLDQRTAAAFAAIASSKKKVVTSHDALGYLGHRYAIEFFPLQGISTEAEPSAKEMARLIREMRKSQIKAVFAENISNPKLIDQIARETGAKVGPAIYSDALAKQAPANSWLGLFEYNTQAILRALQ
ncbi:metal ABC transporter solute-binding protein, Zn/Mn family [Deefgea piscis]|uniref:metal ABC transporter solute-binding protein, Zn/Mn family n=1 Tax=Deefgea piscis TaxID=2739061 RepID=UPI001C80FFCE|nr:zinc ABC transporter substrate-binding protein [Deefgea piscis]QZA81761.1 zinc ABC transporter substrate-binding protein [Deefgea piscis]